MLAGEKKDSRNVKQSGRGEGEGVYEIEQEGELAGDEDKGPDQGFGSQGAQDMKSKGRGD
jgi:hypothetical protein